MHTSSSDQPDPPAIATYRPVRANKLRRAVCDVRFLAALASLVLSVWSIYLDDVVNSDGVLYLRVAEHIQRGDWQGALALYKWPLYPFLIALVNFIPGLGLEYSAHVLNAALTAFAVVVFLSLMRELGADRKTLVAAAILVLLFPGLNRYRAFVIRDAGYIAFYLLALLLFIKDLKERRSALRLGWMASILVATLFRIEGFVFLVALPLVRQWLLSTGTVARAALLAGSAGAALLMLGALAWWIYSGPQLPATPEWGVHLGNLWHSGTAMLSAKIDTIEGVLNDRYERAFAYAVVLAALCILLFWEILATLTPLYAALAGHAIYRHLAFQDPRIRKIWLQLIGLHLLILAAILIVGHFLTGRFPLALSMTLLLAVPFSLAALYAHWQEGRTRRSHWVFPLVCVLLVLTGLAGLYHPTDKGHLKEAGLWVKNHTPGEATLFSNDPLIHWYSGRSRHERPRGYAWDLVLELAHSPQLLQYDYLAVRVKHKQSEQGHSLVEAVGKPPAAVFVNRNGDKALVFALH